MEYITVIIIVLIVVVQVLLVSRLKKIITTFDTLLFKFMNLNQGFYNRQQEAQRRSDKILDKIRLISGGIKEIRDVASQIADLQASLSSVSDQDRSKIREVTKKVEILKTNQLRGALNGQNVDEKPDRINPRNYRRTGKKNRQEDNDY